MTVNFLQGRLICIPSVTNSRFHIYLLLLKYIIIITTTRKCLKKNLFGQWIMLRYLETKRCSEVMQKEVLWFLKPFPDPNSLLNQRQGTTQWRVWNKQDKMSSAITKALSIQASCKRSGWCWSAAWWSFKVRSDNPSTPQVMTSRLFSTSVERKPSGKGKCSSTPGCPQESIEPIEGKRD